VIPTFDGIDTPAVAAIEILATGVAFTVVVSELVELHPPEATVKDVVEMPAVFQMIE